MNVDVAQLYHRFAEIEAKGVSDSYFDLASNVANDAELCALIEALPSMKRQPNLVLAAARFLGAPVNAYAAFREFSIAHWPAITHVIMTRATQTNEAGRCAVLLPQLAKIDGPLALIEAGASAGLTLYPDQYGYRYSTPIGDSVLQPNEAASDVVLPCRIDAANVPQRLPIVEWRAGVDLNPLSVRNADDLAWLEALVWPEHDERRRRLRAAARVVAAEPPHLVRANLLSEIVPLVERAPAGTRVVVFHSSVLVYLTEGERAQFVDLMHDMPDVVWISNEGAGVLPDIAEQVRVPINGRTIVAVNGQAVALVGPHGQSYEAL